MTRRHLPPRRLLAVAAALALIGAPGAQAKSNQGHRKASMDGTAPVCPLGTFLCPPRPDNYAICRPNAMLDFYDPTMTKDSSLRDTANTYTWAEQVDSSNQTVYHMQGNVKLERADQRMQSDTADYNNDTTDYDAKGNVRYQEAGELVKADHIRGNTNDSTGVADNVTYQLLQSRGNGTATQGHMFDAQHSQYTNAIYTTCDVGHHLWEFKAKDLTLNKDTGVGVARKATMRFANVPFLYLPYFTFPIDNRRKSGFLYPTLGNSSRSGFMVSTPYYLNLAPNYDATLDPRIYSDRGPMLAGEFRYLNLLRSTGTLNIEYMPKDHGNNDPGVVDQTKGDDRYLIKWINNTSLGGPFSFGANINRTSDRNYLRDFGNDIYAAATQILTSSAYVNAGGTWWNASFGGDIYQNVDPTLPDSVEPYQRLPRATLNIDVPVNRWLEIGAQTEAVAFRKSEWSNFSVNPDGKSVTVLPQNNALDGKRLDLYPYISADFQGSYWFVRPKLAYRYTAYQLDNDYRQFGYTEQLGTGDISPFTSRTPSRSLPIASLDSGLIFDRNTQLFGTNYTQTLEPRLYYLYVPYRNQNNLPLFDTSLMSFDYWQLFSPNQYSGADRQMNANNLTAAITSRLLDENGVERLALSFGQIRYFTQQRVQLPNGNGALNIPTATNYNGSDYVAQLTSQLSDDWRASASYQWNPNTRQTDMGAVELQHRIKTDGVLNFSYRFRRQPGATSVLLEQYDASIVYPVSDRWRLLGRWTYSVLDKKTVEALAGVEYDSCCVAVRLVGRHYVNNVDFYNPQTASTNTAIMFELEFKGLGAFNGQTEGILRRGILGYQ
ncbi:LPS-assembly protein LptD [Dyella sp.]|uniref:LPS-assembly protein LptD n=1 Tax=Dyella sp. TaxID=1869338 RepID=UPI002ED63B3A